MCRILRRHEVAVRVERVCVDCDRPICKGERAIKTEYAELDTSGGREHIRTEYSCCHLRVAWIRPHTGHNVWGARQSASRT